jgi:omega-6 fatty acid desaturase (delta-12 desaturase)
MSEFREGKALIAASRPFTVEKKALSWFHVLSTLAVIAVLLTAAVMAPFWPLQLVASILAGLTIVRGFILYHDFHHGALLSYPMMTVEMWKKATPAQRRFYRIARHPLTILFGYVFIFQYGMCVSGFLRRPEKNWDSALALVLHFAIIGVVGYYFGLNVLFFGVILPLMVACCTGAYLFYAQHNFEGMHLQPRENWSYTRAAIESSSYMKTGVFWGWMTGNIGYHHVHHLNPGIPFYRLPEAHEAIPELQQAKTTSLWPRDISACFRLKIWDPEKQQMVGYPS